MRRGGREPAEQRSPHGELLAMLAAKLPTTGKRTRYLHTIGEVVAKWCGGDSEGRLVQAQVLDALRAAAPTVHSRRQLLEQLLRSFEKARRHGAQWRVTGPEAFPGHQHQEEQPASARPPAREFIDRRTGEIRHRPYRKLQLKHLTWRPHCPGKSAGGLAAHCHRSPRQIGRYRRTLRAVKLMQSEQPDAKARDAVLPKKRPRHSDGKWAYGQHWLGFKPPAVMRRRWETPSKARTQARAAAPSRPRGPWSAAHPPRVGELLDLRDLAELDST